MSNSKRIVRHVGRPRLLDDIERVYRFIWLQPHSESQVPFKAKVYDDPDRGGWSGYRADDPAQLEITWMSALWKEVPDPLAVDPQPLPPPLPPESSEPLQAVTEDDSDAETLEVPTS